MARTRSGSRRNGRELTLEELAEAAGMTVRNVRSYQTRGLIPAPRRRGRRSVYTEEHLRQLRRIRLARARGASLGLIASHLAAGGTLTGDLETTWLPAHTVDLREPAATPVGLVSVQRLLAAPTAPAAAVESAVTHLAALGLMHRDGHQILTDPRLATGLSSAVAAGLPITSALTVLGAAAAAGRSVLGSIEAAIPEDPDVARSRRVLLEVVCSAMSCVLDPRAPGLIRSDQV